MYDQQSYTKVFGLRVVVSPLLPIIPSDADNIRRIVRHGLKDVLEWLGEPVGPEPGVVTECIVTHEDPILKEPVVYVSGDLYVRIERETMWGHAGEAIKKIWLTYDELLRTSWL